MTVRNSIFILIVNIVLKVLINLPLLAFLRFDIPMIQSERKFKMFFLVNKGHIWSEYKRQ